MVAIDFDVLVVFVDVERVVVAEEGVLVDIVVVTIDDEVVVGLIVGVGVVVDSGAVVMVVGAEDFAENLVGVLVEIVVDRTVVRVVDDTVLGGAVSVVDFVVGRVVDTVEVCIVDRTVEELVVTVVLGDSVVVNEVKGLEKVDVTDGFDINAVGFFVGGWVTVKIDQYVNMSFRTLLKRVHVHVCSVLLDMFLYVCLQTCQKVSHLCELIKHASQP